MPNPVIRNQLKQQNPQTDVEQQQSDIIIHLTLDMQVAEHCMHYFSGTACIQGHMHASIHVHMHVASYIKISSHI